MFRAGAAIGRKGDGTSAFAEECRCEGEDVSGASDGANNGNDNAAPSCSITHGGNTSSSLDASSFSRRACERTIWSPLPQVETAAVDRMQWEVVRR